jgi:hypothetical protein
MKTRTLSLVCLLLSVMPSTLHAQYDYVFIYDNASYADNIAFGTASGWTVGYDGEVRLSVSAKQSYCGIYKQNGQDGWNGSTGWYEQDIRPAISAGETVVENVYLWAGTLAPAGDLHLYQVYSPILAEGMTYSLRLVQIPVGVTYTGPTEWGPDHGTIILPFYATDNPLTGYKFEAEITAPVPEPSSILALAGGIAGLGGLAMRRKRT